MDDVVDSRKKEILDKYNDPKTGLNGVRAFALKNGFKLKEAEEALKSSDVYTLNRNVVRNFERRKTYAGEVDQQWQADLADMQGQEKDNKGYKYILVVIDVFSRYLWCEALKSKSGDEVSKGFKKIFESVHPKKLQTDQGTEFFNTKMTALCKKYDIHQFHTYSEVKAAIAERVIRTLRMRLTRLWDVQGNFNWTNSLGDIVIAYNNSIHRTIKMTPTEAREGKNAEKVHHNLYDLDDIKTEKVLKIGTPVRIALSRGIFTKEQVSGWSREVFYVNRVNGTYPLTYQLKDDKDEPVIGGFYRQELQEITEPEAYGVEILDTRKRKGKKQVLVKWVGYDLEPEWIDESQLE